MWIQTYSGKKFALNCPKEEDIDILDIAHSLSMQCRYNGHCRSFYSVAEHSYLMSIWDLPGCPEWRLLHDAAEAYISDIPTPVKRQLPFIYELENRILSLIQSKFNLPPYCREEIKQADLVMLATEKRDLMLCDLDWGSLPTPMSFIITPDSPVLSRSNFLSRARELGIY